MPDTVVECYMGLMGGGKSYMAVEKMSKHFLKGGIVYTNLDLNWDIIKKWAYRDNGVILDDRQYNLLDTAQLREFPRHISAGTDKNPVMVVADECSLFFDAREWNKTSKEVLAFLTQVRKVSVHLILITQHIKDIDAKMRNRVHYLWTFVDVQKICIFGIRPPFPLMIRNCYNGIDRQNRLHRRYVKKDPRIFSFYNSKQKFTEMHLKESEDIDLEKVEPEPQKHPPMKGKTILIIGATMFVSWYLFGRHKEPDINLQTGPIVNESSYSRNTVSKNGENTQEIEEEIYVTRLTLNGAEYYIEFSNDTFITHHSNARINYQHEYVLINSIPFRIKVGYEQSPKQEEPRGVFSLGK